MKKVLLLLTGLTLCLQGSGQSVTPEVVATAGDHYATGYAELSWTVGEPAIETYSAGETFLTQGFHQTTITVTGIKQNFGDIPVSVFPNPVSGQLSVMLGNASGKSSFELFDVKGRMLLNTDLLSNTTSQFNLSGLPSGAYFVQLRNNAHHYSNTYKIIKIK